MQVIKRNGETADFDKDKIYNAILKAMKNQLWIEDKGYFAEYKDALGNQIVHDKPGIWSIYHVSDAFILNEFEDYQNNTHIPSRQAVRNPIVQT